MLRKDVSIDTPVPAVRPTHRSISVAPHSACQCPPNTLFYLIAARCSRSATKHPIAKPSFPHSRSSPLSGNRCRCSRWTPWHLPHLRPSSPLSDARIPARFVADWLSSLQLLDSQCGSSRNRQSTVACNTSLPAELYGNTSRRSICGYALETLVIVLSWRRRHWR